MKILLVTSEFPPGPGGIGNHAYNLSLQLQKHGHTVWISAADREGFPSGEFDSKQPITIVREAADASRIKRLLNLIRLLKDQGRTLDYIILSGLTNLALFTVLRLFVRTPVLCIAHGHEVIMAKGVMGFLVRRCLEKADSVVAVSEFSKNLMVQNGIKRFIHIIPNGVNLRLEVRVKPKTNDKLVLITVGSITKRKGQHNIVNALPALIRKFTNVEYHIVGIPRNREEIERLAQGLHVEQHVIIHGAVGEETKTQLLSGADLFMMLSENLPDGDVEGFGIAVLEANSLGLPAIGSQGTGVEQAINRGKSGLIVNAQDPDHICQAVSDIVVNYADFSREAISWAQQHAWDKIIIRYLDILK